MNYNVGSVWKRWDLHIHNPFSSFNNNFRGENLESKWDNYFSKIEESIDVKVIGVTDYFSVKGYKYIVEAKNSGRLSNIETILPNIEFRILPVTEQNRSINLHLIFNPSIIQEIEIRFFTNLKFEFDGNYYTCTEQDLIKLGRAFKNEPNLVEQIAYNEGVQQFKITIEHLKEIIKTNKIIRENCLIGVANSNNDGNSGIQHSSLAATRQEIYRFADFIISSNPNDTKYFLGNGTDSKEECIRKYGRLKPCITGSDAHSIDEIFNNHGNRHTWIKADTTFEGLKQIVFEPEERIRIQASDPTCDYTKPSFSKITIQDVTNIFTDQSVKFDKAVIELNQNLVSIIGGRGEGKSVLIDYIAAGFGYSQKTYNLVNKFFVQYLKSNCTDDYIEYEFSKENNLDYLYIHQNMVKERALESKALGKEIRQMLNLPDLGFSKEVQDDIYNIVERYNSYMQWFNEVDSDGNKVNEKTNLLKEKKKNEDLLSSITNKNNKARLEKYTSNIEALRNEEIKIQQLEKLNSRLINFEKEFNGSISQFANEISLISFNIQYDEIKRLKESISDKIKDIEKENEEIKTEFSNIYKGDLSALLYKADEYKSKIEEIKSALLDYDEREKVFNQIKEEKRNISKKIIDELNRQEIVINDAWENLLEKNSNWTNEQKELMNSILSDREIEIKGTIFFDAKAFYNGIREHINGTYWRNKNKIGELEEYFKIKDHVSFCNFIKDRLESEIMDHPELYYAVPFEYYFFSINQRSNYLYVQPQITYKGKSLEKISVGQRGTLYLCLKLATNPFSTPIIYDQPEDDLDNQFIINELVQIFKKIKLYRQVIIVTHNANLVVNSDSEQVIIAKNTEETLAYESGALENHSIIEAVCEILEGGKTAFEQRKNKYKI